jgi:ligand-binding SRPBCC domain-containing protein
MKTFEHSSELSLAYPLSRVFQFFSDAANLEQLTPPWLNFHIITPQPIPMAVGARIQYRLRLHGFPLRWESKITTWDPPHRFVDQQLRGPYRLWYHEHTFTERDARTIVRDRVTYAVFGGSLINSLFVAPDIARIFAYRTARLSELFPEPST